MKSSEICAFAFRAYVFIMDSNSPISTDIQGVSKRFCKWIEIERVRGSKNLYFYIWLVEFKWNLLIDQQLYYKIFEILD